MAAMSFAQQDVADQPAAGQRQVLQAKVIRVDGMVKKAPLGVSAIDPGWADVVLNEMLPGGTQIKTGFRSSVVLEFGDDTIVQIRKASLVSIDDYYKTATEKSILMGLGYGAIRGGSTEAELRTDVVVDSTVATLAKRGTEGWQLVVEPTTGRFEVSLARAGLVEARLKATRERRTVRPNEYVNDRNIKLMWINQDIFDRKVSFYDKASVTESEFKFAAENPGGGSVVSPDASQATQITKRIDPTFVAQQIARQQAADAPKPPRLAPPLFRTRPEGDFGIPPTLQNLLGGLGLGDLSVAKGRTPPRRLPVGQSSNVRRNTTRVRFKR